MPILLYDGVCGLCNRFVQFILRRDHAIFRFASLQSDFAARILARHRADPSELDTVYVVLNHELANESLLVRSDAIGFVLHELGGVWRVASFLLLLTPRVVRDWAYNAIARNRYRVFGRSEGCT